MLKGIYKKLLPSVKGNTIDYTREVGERYVYVYVCMWVCVYVCVYVGMCVCVQVCMCVSLYVCIYVLGDKITYRTIFQAFFGQIIK